MKTKIFIFTDPSAPAYKGGELPGVHILWLFSIDFLPLDLAILPETDNRDSFINLAKALKQQV